MPFTADAESWPRPVADRPQRASAHGTTVAVKRRMLRESAAPSCRSRRDCPATTADAGVLGAPGTEGSTARRRARGRLLYYPHEPHTGPSAASDDTAAGRRGG